MDETNVAECYASKHAVPSGWNYKDERSLSIRDEELSTFNNQQYLLMYLLCN